jgi:hypothetical protein
MVYRANLCGIWEREQTDDDEGDEQQGGGDSRRRAPAAWGLVERHRREKAGAIERMRASCAIGPQWSVLSTSNWKSPVVATPSYFTRLPKPCTRHPSTSIFLRLSGHLDAQQACFLPTIMLMNVFSLFSPSFSLHQLFTPASLQIRKRIRIPSTAARSTVTPAF